MPQPFDWLFRRREEGGFHDGDFAEVGFDGHAHLIFGIGREPIFGRNEAKVGRWNIRHQFVIRQLVLELEDLGRGHQPF